MEKMSCSIELYDTTLRDGTQGEDIAFTVEDKLLIVEALDKFGIPCIEGGWPGSNPRDDEFFLRVGAMPLNTSRVVAFGATHRAGVRVNKDPGIDCLLRAETEIVTIFGKTSWRNVLNDLGISANENLILIRETVDYLKRHDRRVVFDAEHFFDGFRENWEYSLRCLVAAAEAGADVLCLCDTKGGSSPGQIAEAIDKIRSLPQVPQLPLGIHCHNDSELAVANTLTAVEHGATQVQGTINGFGERCGNTNLCSVIPVLQLKMGRKVVPDLTGLRRLSRFVCERANMNPNSYQPFVGESAFAHKAGMHVAAVQKDSSAYEHVEPSAVGNRRRVLMSDLSGRNNIIYKAQELGIKIDPDDQRVGHAVALLKDKEYRGFQFDGADASFELWLRRHFGEQVHHFHLIHYRVIGEQHGEGKKTEAEASVRLKLPDDTICHTVATGKGPIDALHYALHQALNKGYPQVNQLQLLDYKVRILGDGNRGSGAVVRVLVESRDERNHFGTVGVDDDIFKASWQALVDAVDYKLYKDVHGGRNWL